MARARERKKAFINQEIERTKTHLADQKARKLKKQQIKAAKKEGRVKQIRKEKKYHKSDILQQQQDEAERKHKKLFARMTFRATDLKPGIMYRIRVSAINNTGEGPFSKASFSTFTLSEAPAKGDPPHRLSAELTSMMIEWTTPHDNGAAITSFVLRQCYDGVEHEFKRTVQRVKVTNLLPGHGYSFQVKSANSEGWSDWSDESTPLYTLTKEPDVPEKPVVVDKTPVTITIKVRRPEENGEPIQQYIVRKREMSVKRKTAWGPAGAFGLMEHADEPLEKEEEIDDPKPPHGKIKVKFAYITIDRLGPASHYDFQVACKNKSGTSEYSVSSFRTKTLPAQKPSKVGAIWTTNVGPTSLVLCWDEPENNGSRILGYNIEERSREHNRVKPSDEHKEEYSCGDVQRKKVDALETSSAYRFRIQARNAAGLSGWSAYSSYVESVQNDPKRMEGGGGGGEKEPGGMEKFSSKGLGGEDVDSDDSEEEEDDF
jgi:hypothetical protein